MDHRPGDIAIWIEEARNVAFDYEIEGSKEVVHALQEMMLKHDASNESAAHLGAVMARIFGDFLAHWMLATHQISECPNCLVQIMHIVAAHYRKGVSDAVATSKRIDDAEAAANQNHELTSFGPGPGDKVN